MAPCIKHLSTQPTLNFRAQALGRWIVLEGLEQGKELERGEFLRKRSREKGNLNMDGKEMGSDCCH